jgi:predicted ribosome quality control (RQC) complex YloA/Tae2 family protein
MALSATEIEQVLTEIQPVLGTGWIQRIHQPTDRTLVFEIRVPGETHRLLISCAPETARLHLSRLTLPNPPSPPPFCQFLRAHLQGARIDGIQQLSNDRIVAILLTTKDGPRTVVCELTGKTANMLVLDEDQHVLRDLNRQRELLGHAYHPPARRTNGIEPDKAVRFAITSGAGDFPISGAIEVLYHEKEANLVRDHAKEARLRVLKKTVKKQQRRIEAWRDDLAKSVQYRNYARYGELLKTNLGSIPKGMDRITLVDYCDEAMPEVTIPLDSAKSSQGNMDDYFRKHRKFLTAERELKPRIAQAECDLERLKQELTAIEQSTWTPPAALPSAAGAVIRPHSRKRQESNEEQRVPFRRFTSTDGLRIFVGRNARENDELTFGLAKSDDLWLHARGTPGSHVVVRLEKGKESPPETLRDAATLALLYSDLKKSGKGEVIYTRRKWVMKAKGQAPGAVIVTQEKALLVHLDKARLAALKSRSEEAV